MSENERTHKGIELIRKGDEILFWAQFTAAEERARMRRWYKACVIIQFLLTFFSVGCAFIQIYIAKDAQNTEREAWNVVLVTLSGCFSVACCIIIIVRYSAKHHSFSLRMSYEISFFHFLNLRGKLWAFLFELLFVCVLPYSSDPSISNWMITVMIFRLLYPISLMIHSFSDLKKKQANICENLKEFSQKSPKFGVAMNLRYIFKYYGVYLTIGIYACFILLFAYMFFASDRIGDSENPRSLQYHVTIYWAVITATTVGYGDITPIGTFQQALSIVLVLIGVIMSSLLMGFITSSMGLKDNERKALQVAEKKILERKKKNAAARVIQSMIRIKSYSISKETACSQLKEIPKFAELRNKLFTSLAELYEIQETLHNNYNFDPDRAENKDSYELINRAWELAERHKRLDDLLESSNEMMDELMKGSDPFAKSAERQ